MFNKIIIPLKLAISIIILNFFISCSSNNPSIYSSNFCGQKFKSVNFEILKDSSSRYDSSFVEISGYYRWDPETSVISELPTGINLQDMVWVSFDSDLFRIKGQDTLFIIRTEKEFKKIVNKKITIRGRLIVKGDKFIARIDQVCYLKF